MLDVKVIEGDKDASIQDAYFIRDVVFSKEQGFDPDIDIDEKDPISYHVILYFDQNPIGTARLIPYENGGKIGRVAIIKSERGKKYGALIMNALKEKAIELNYAFIALSSQTHAIGFYEKLGFVTEGDVYLEEGAPHIFMKQML